jgi:hypothetical protein
MKVMKIAQAARLYVLTRGRDVTHYHDDVEALTLLLGECVIAGMLAGFDRSKDIFRQSSDARGQCRYLSRGEACECFLCCVDKEVQQVKKE